MIVQTYITYIAISVALTIWVARTLHKNGRVFLIDVFAGNEAFADSVNHLLVVGFYLINFGFITLAMKSEEQVLTYRAAIEMLSTKIGIAVLVLGAMHFLNLGIFSKFRTQQLARRDAAEWRARQTTPPVQPVSPGY